MRDPQWPHLVGADSQGHPLFWGDEASWPDTDQHGLTFHEGFLPYNRNPQDFIPWDQGGGFSPSSLVKLGLEGLGAYTPHIGRNSPV